jgi:ATP-dependent DNA helicase Q4
VLREQSEKNLLNLLKITHGFDYFHSGQLETIKRVIAVQSTMLALPTGSGKYLCYQLTTLILPGVILVISPLVALMVDQLQHLPTIIPGSLLTGGQT